MTSEIDYPERWSSTFINDTRNSNAIRSRTYCWNYSGHVVRASILCSALFSLLVNVDVLGRRSNVHSVFAFCWLNDQVLMTCDAVALFLALCHICFCVKSNVFTRTLWNIWFGSLLHTQYSLDDVWK